MNPATLDAARLFDADILHFLAAVGWGVNAGLALIFLIPRPDGSLPSGERAFWITTATAFLSVGAVCAATVLSRFGGLFQTPETLERIAQTGAASAILFSLALLPWALEIRAVRVWRVGGMLLAAMMAAVVAVPSLVAGWWLGLCAGVAGAALWAGAWVRHRRAGADDDHLPVFFGLGGMLLALSVVLGARHGVSISWNGAIAPGVGGILHRWQGGMLAVAAVISLGTLWWSYLQACTLPSIRARRVIFGVRPIFVLPMLEGVVLLVGAAWFVASSRQSEDYAGRRLRAEVAALIEASDLALPGPMGNEASDIRAGLERVVARSDTFLAAVAWREAGTQRPELIAAVTRDRAPLPFDAQHLLPTPREALDLAGRDGGLRWIHGRFAYERAVVFVPVSGPWTMPWQLSIALDARDLASLVATHRLQALAILGLAIVLVAFAVVYTMRTLNEAELRLLKESAEAENHGRNAFLGMISHEIRTPLQSVLGYAELAEGAGLPDAAARHVRAIRSQGAILLRIVQDILDFSALRGGALTLNPEVVSLRELLDDVQRGMAGRAHAKGIVFSTEIDGQVPAWVMVDRVRLTQVLLNLAVNAVKFTDRGGVRVAVGCSAVVDGRASIEILVSDTGPGINPVQMRRLFEPFRKMRDDDTPGGGGVGLGLAISRQIVDVLGGTITAESADGEGTVFRIGLSLAVAEGHLPATVRAASAAALEPAEVPSLAGLAVLVIDDNPYVRDLLRDFLHTLGARVVARPDGASSVVACTEQAFDVVLMDLRLPDVAGADLAARLRAAGRSPTDPWIVGISAGVSDAEIQETLDRGVNDFVLKPVSMAGLAETIRMSPASSRIQADARPIAARERLGVTADQHAAFVAELEPMFDRLEQSCLEEQGRRLGAEAHYLANGCMVAGFDEGLAVCREIEQLAEAGAFDAARLRIAALRSRFAGGAVARGA